MATRDDLMSCYQILGLDPGASVEAVRKAYKRLVRSWHPDQFMHDESMRRMAERQMKIINTSYKTLSEFLSFRPPFRFQDDRAEPPTRTAERNRGRGRRRESAVSRSRARTKAWWQRIRFSFEDPEFFGPSIIVFFKTMSYGLIAWAGALGSIAAFEALPRDVRSFLANDVSFVVYVAGYLGMIVLVVVRRRE